VAQPGAAAACADVAGEADVEEAGAEAAAEDAAEDEGADTVVEAEATGGAEDELPAAQPATTDPAAANPASLSNNETEPVITITLSEHPAMREPNARPPYVADCTRYFV
jgi:hypothetical protein